IGIDDTAQINATVIPANASNKTILWTSSNQSIATVSSSGQVVGVAEGVVTIMARTADGSYIATCVVTVEDVLTNIALNRMATTDSFSAAATPSKAVDGLTNTRWTADKGGNNPVSLTINFNEQVSFRKIKIVEQLDRITNFELQYWDGTGFVPFHIGTTMGSDFVIDTPTIITTQIRLSVLSTINDNAVASIFEFEVHGKVLSPEVLPTNLALSASATANITSGGNVAGNMVDGNVDTRWMAPTSTTNAILEIDFGAVTSFNQLRFREYLHRVSGFEVQYFDGTNWVTCYTRDTIGTLYIADLGAIASSKIRVIINELVSTAGASFSEIEVYNVIN
ncbi:MAG: discoidin domain-containing protein, partial [Lachnospiraceae bacterium]|nr:discoidin domain-containing protein [Lachnospiraceae bacterium]